LAPSGVFVLRVASTMRRKVLTTDFGSIFPFRDALREAGDPARSAKG
jgi:hypothetical protein